MFKDFYLNIELVDDNAKIPVRAHSTDAGMDVFAISGFTIPPQEDKCVSLGWKCEFPEGYALIVKEKSGRAVKNKLDVGACVIDANYRSEVHVHLFNNSTTDPVIIEAGEKIAQIIVVPIWTGTPKEVPYIDVNTDRGTGGFGSTGLK